MNNYEDKEYAIDSSTESSSLSNITLLVEEVAKAEAIDLTGDIGKVIAETEITPIGTLDKIERDEKIEKAIMQKVKAVAEIIATKPKAKEVTREVVVIEAMAKKSVAEKAELMAKITAGELAKEIAKIIAETEVTPIGRQDETKRNEKIKEVMREKVKIMVDLVTAKISGEDTREAEAVVEARTAADDHEVDERQSHDHSLLGTSSESNIEMDA